MMTPFVTVIVPVRNEERFLGTTLRALLAQHYPADRFEVLVADGQSDDDTPPSSAGFRPTTPTSTCSTTRGGCPARPATSASATPAATTS